MTTIVRPPADPDALESAPAPAGAATPTVHDRSATASDVVSMTDQGLTAQIEHCATLIRDGRASEREYTLFITATRELRRRRRVP
jgi:hypothetical protein